MRVLQTPDHHWRAELHRDGWRLWWHGGLMIDRATLDQVVAKMLELGGTPEELAED